MNPGTAGGGGETIVGAALACFSPTRMSRTIAGIGEGVILSNNVMLAGHCQIGDFAIFSGGAAAHQFVRIGAHAFVGGLAGVEHDIIPFGMALGNRGSLAGLNFVGLKRRGFSHEAIHDAAARLQAAVLRPGHAEGARRGRRRGVSRRGGGAADRRLPARGRRPRDLHSARGQGRGGVTRQRSRAAAGDPLRRRRLAAGGRPSSREAGREVFLVGLVGSAERRDRGFPHVWVRLGEVGKLFARAEGARRSARLAMLGAVARPEFADLRLDWGAVKRAGEIAQLFRGGDNGLLDGVARIFEREGVRIVGVADFAPRLLAPRRRASPGRAPDAEDAGRHRLRRAAASRRCRRSTSGRARWSRASACWRSRRPRAPTRCSPRVAEMRASGRLRLKGRGGRVRQGAPSAGRICASTCRRSAGDDRRGARAPSSRRGDRRRRGARSPSASVASRAADAAGLFVVGFERERRDRLRIALVAGEHSGDQLGFKLMRALREAHGGRRRVSRRRRRGDGGRRA